LRCAMSPLAHLSLSLSLSSRITWRDPHAYKTLPLNHEYLHIAKRRGRGRTGPEGRREEGSRKNRRYRGIEGRCQNRVTRYTRDVLRVLSKQDVYKVDSLFFFFSLSLCLSLSLFLSLMSAFPPVFASRKRRPSRTSSSETRHGAYLLQSNLSA